MSSDEALRIMEKWNALERTYAFCAVCKQETAQCQNPEHQATGSKCLNCSGNANKAKTICLLCCQAEDMDSYSASNWLPQS